MKDFLKTWWFGLLLSACLIVFEILTTLVPILSTPPGYRWLGAGIFNTGDMAVYLNYLAQAKHSFLIINLFNNLPQVPRFDLFWSVGGLIVRAGLPPLMAHEILRWLCTIILGLAIYATAKAATKTERHARITSLLVVGGLSTGWIYDLWMGLADKWTHHSPATADLASEFAVAPTLLGGAHMILSLALQILVVRWIWEAIFLLSKKCLLYACIAALALSAFHPYFIPLFGLISLISFFASLKSHKWKKPLLYSLLINFCLLPSALYYFWIMMNDQGFRVHQTQINSLPLDAWYFWVIMLVPFIIAIVWMVYRRQCTDTKWVMSWVVAALICMLLPFPWTRKYTQGLLPALVLMTLPFWLMLADKISSKKIILPFKLCLVVLIAFPYIHLFQTQIFMVTDPYWSKNFYRSLEVFKAWDYIKQTSKENDLLLATDQWSNYWTPAYTTQKVWIGHEHETPDFKSRITPYLDWIKTSNATSFQDYLDKVPVTKIIASDPNQVERLETLMDKNAWEEVYKSAKAAVWQRK